MGFNSGFKGLSLNYMNFFDIHDDSASEQTENVLVTMGRFRATIFTEEKP